MKYDYIDLLHKVNEENITILKRLSTKNIKLDFDIEKAKKDIKDDEFDFDVLDQPFGSLELAKKSGKKYLDFNKEKSNSLPGDINLDKKEKDELLDILSLSENIHVLSSKKLNNTKKVIDNFEEIYKMEKKFGLMDVLNDSFKRKYFKIYCAKEFSMENILFWEIVMKFKETKELKKRYLLADEIFNSFLNDDSALNINTSKILINKTMVNYQKQKNKGICEPDLFDEIRKDVQFGVMKDTFFRFERTPLYKEMLVAKPKTSTLFESYESESDVLESLIDTGLEFNLN